MPRAPQKTREEARRLFLTGEMATNAEIAAYLRIKPHTVGEWHRQEDWDSLRRKIDKRAAELFVEKIASDRVALNTQHFKLWGVVVSKLLEQMKGEPTEKEIRVLDKAAGILDRAQRGQRLARGRALDGKTEEQIRAEAQAEIRELIDVFVDTVKEHVPDEEARDRVAQTILARLPAEDDQDESELTH